MPGFVEYSAKVPKLKYFFGREKELKTLVEWTNADKFIVLQGIAGIGKSALSAKLLQSMIGKRNTFWYKMQEWDSLRSIMTSLAEFLALLGKDELKSYLKTKKMFELDEVWDLIDTHLASSNTLLVFDDIHKAKQDLLPFFSMLKEITADRSGVSVLVTTRNYVPIYDAADIKVKDIVSEMTLEGLDPSACRALIAARLGGLPQGDIDHLAKFTEGHPLMIELARASDGIVARLDPQQRDMMAYIQQEMLGKLDGEARKLLSYMSVFRHPVSAEALVYEDTISYDVLDAVQKMNLIIEVNGGKYELHDVIREYFYSRLSTQQKKAYHAIAARYYLESKSSADAIADVLEVIYHMINSDEYRTAANIAAEQGNKLMNAGLNEELLALVLKIELSQLPPSEASDILSLKGSIYSVWGEWDEAIVNYRAALEYLLAESQGTTDIFQIEHVFLTYRDGRLIASKSLSDSLIDDEVVMSMLTAIQDFVKDSFSSKGEGIDELKYGEMRIIIERGKHIFAAVVLSGEGALPDKMRLQMRALVSYIEGKFEGLLRNWNGDLTKMKDVQEILDNAVLLPRIHEEKIGATCEQIGNLNMYGGEWAAAEEYLSKSLKAFRLSGSEIGQARALGSLGMVNQEKGDTKQAIRYYEKALEMFDRLGSTQLCAALMNNLGTMYMTTGDYKNAERIYAKALPLFEKLEYAHLITEAKKNIEKIRQG